MIKNYFPALVFSLFIFFSCTQPKNTAPEEIKAPATDAGALLHSFLPGLWSLDSGNILTNEGFLIRPDGAFSFVASEINGNWETPTTDSLIIRYSGDYDNKQISYRIDSINESQMILSSESDKKIFRKVPYGENQQETVLSGSSGSILPGMNREYNINLPGGKRIGLKLTTESKEIKFSLSLNGQSIATDVSSWNGILIRSGNYKVNLTYKTKSKDPADFDLKVISY